MACKIFIKFQCFRVSNNSTARCVKLFILKKIYFNRVSVLHKGLILIPRSLKSVKIVIKINCQIKLTKPDG